MEIKIRKNDGDIYLIELSGALDLSGSEKLKELVMKMIGKKVERFIIGLNGVDSVNSEGLGALIYISSTLKKLNCPLALMVPDGPVMQALEISKVKSYFTFAVSLKEAVGLVSAGP